MRHFTLPKDGGLIEAGMPEGLLHGFEKIRTEIFPDSTDASDVIADVIVNAINDFQAGNPDRHFKLGLTTGASPVSLYNWLVHRYNEGKVSFKDVDLYSIDEFYPASPDQLQSRNYRIHADFLDKVDATPENVFIPDGTVPQDKISEYCAAFEEKVRNLDILIVGVGEHGQLAFNEAGVSFKSRTRTVLFSYKVRKKYSKSFNGSIKDTPHAGISIGIETMLSARKIILLAWGEEKAEAVWHVAEGDPDNVWPASGLQGHPDVTLYADETSAAMLTREVAPWMVGPCIWTKKFVRKAVVWLCDTVHKPILKLTHQDYHQNSLGELLEKYGTFDKVNIDVFNDLQHTITGWPGGKPNADDSTRPVKSFPFPKTVLIFSPHPDDDVISMGGTFIRLVEQGHDVHVAYQTSGDLAVHDDVVLQHMDAAYEIGYESRFNDVQAVIDSKRPGAPEPAELLALKAAIRRSEAKAAVRSFGVNDKTNAHFLNLPFYESGGVTKLPRTQVDVDIIKELIMKIKPDQIYMAGDLADPHGTHRVCTEAALEAVEQLKEEGQAWLKRTTIWLYRGAWLEWELGRVDMAVPLSPQELIQKRHAIFRHLSQKDIVPFPGDDPREFWQRAEDRTQGTAQHYDALGMSEYQAMEVFLKLDL